MLNIFPTMLLIKYAFTSNVHCIKVHGRLIGGLFINLTFHRQRLITTATAATHNNTASHFMHSSPLTAKLIGNFYRATACNAMHSIAIAILPFRLSVRCVYCDKTK